MSDPPSPLSGEPLVLGELVEWTPDGPRSPRFDDVYFSTTDGLEESRLVFLTGCDLPAAWAGRRRFTVGELGFGTGLNILALLQAWAEHRPGPNARLSIFSIEGFPLPRGEAARALGAWPELATLAAPLLNAWPKGRRGAHLIDWPDLGATLDLHIGDVEPALIGWTGAADAWFLDGFAPSKNPQMWSETVLAAVVARSAPGARAATFTVAGAVRRGLEGCGFALEKRPGFGRKRERLEARAPGERPTETAPPSVLVIGAGIAAAALVQALTRAGAASVTVLAGEDAGASRNAAALVTPRLDAGGGVVARLHAQAFARAVTLYDAEPGAVLARGALQLARTDRDPGRFATLAAWEGFDPDAVTLMTPGEVADRLGETATAPGLDLADARVVEPGAILDRWLAPATHLRGEVARLEQDGAGGWRALDAGGVTLACADVVVLAAGWGAAALAPILALRPVRGQATVAAAAFDGSPAAWGAYVIPTRDGVLFGASHVPGDAGGEVREGERADNLHRLAQARPALAARLAALPPGAFTDRAAVRATTPDHLPLAGPGAGAGEAPGLFVLGGLGGRGFCLAPLLAEHVAALIVGAPSPLDQACAAAVSPSRRSQTSPRTQVS